MATDGWSTHSRLDGTAVAGSVVLVGLVAFDRLEIVAAWILLGVLVATPLTLPLALTADRAGRLSLVDRATITLVPPAVALAAASFLLPRNRTAVALVLPWAAVSVLVALGGVRRLLARGLHPPEEALVAAGRLYLPVGATGLLLSRAGIWLEFTPVIVQLSAVHFHFAGFVLPVVLGAAGRAIDRYRRIYAVAALGAATGMGVVAVGITYSPLVELLGAVVVGTSVVTLAWLAVTAVRGRDTPSWAGSLVVLAALSVSAAMALAVAYSYGQFAPARTLSVGTMLGTHGVLNALGFGLPSVFAWRRIDPPARDSPPGIPFSPLFGGLVVGGDWPERTGVAGDCEPSGQVESMGTYARDDFDPDDLAPEVRRFYERTGDYDLAYRVRWHPGFRLGARLAAAVTHRIEQLGLPVDDAVHRVDSRLVTLDPDADSRNGSRVWVRTDRETGRGVFVAAYATHEHDGVTYVNIGLPLPFSNLTAILVPEHASGGGLQLSSVARGGDEGLYLVTPLGPLKLPIEERFQVRPADHPDAPEPVTPDCDLTAVHEMWLLGRQFLTIRYGIASVEDGGAISDDSGQ